MTVHLAVYREGTETISKIVPDPVALQPLSHMSRFAATHSLPINCPGLSCLPPRSHLPRSLPCLSLLPVVPSHTPTYASPLPLTLFMAVIRPDDELLEEPSCNRLLQTPCHRNRQPRQSWRSNFNKQQN